MKIAPDPWPVGEWHRRLADAVRDLDELRSLLDLDPAALGIDAAARAGRRFPLRVPRGFVARMRRGDPDDPLLRQVLPVPAEDKDVPGFTANPVGELDLARDDGLMSKYRGRVLMIATGTCAVHCRYCFRKHFPYGEQRQDDRVFGQPLDAIAADPTIEEVILSGGDPLVLTDRRLATLSASLGAIPHVRRLRIHTRMPVVLPERVDEDLVAWLEAFPIPVVVVIHANHPNELDDSVQRALGALDVAGVRLLNQSVLLRGVNDSVETLENLSKRLIDCGVMPYYLHILDRVAGSAHFEVDESRALEIMESLQARLPGYLVPRLVREVEGAPSKMAVI